MKKSLEDITIDYGDRRVEIKGADEVEIFT